MSKKSKTSFKKMFKHTKKSAPILNTINLDWNSIPEWDSSTVLPPLQLVPRGNLPSADSPSVEPSISIYPLF